MGRYLLPLGIFIALAVLLGIGLTLDPREVPSPLIGKPAPAFDLPTLHDTERNITPADMGGEVALVNVWASWCVACRQEHPLLVELGKTGEIPIYGINYKDERADALRWLQVFGDPYAESIFDRQGSAGFDWGVYGVPETFVLDAKGIIRHKHIGPITAKDLNEEILPLIRELRAGGAS